MLVVHITLYVEAKQKELVLPYGIGRKEGLNPHIPPPLDPTYVNDFNYFETPSLPAPMTLPISLFTSMPANAEGETSALGSAGVRVPTRNANLRNYRTLPTAHFFLGKFGTRRQYD